MKVTKENLQWATKLLHRLRYMEKFPQDKEYMGDVAASFLRMVQNRSYEDWVRDYPASAEVLEEGQTDAEWLVQAILETQTVFPVPVRMRAIYSRHFTPANDKQMQPLIDDSDPF